MKKDKEVVMLGAALSSTVKQILTLGKTGEEILKQCNFDYKNIDLDKTYSYKIRTKIHNLVKKRYGYQALYLFGYTLGEGFKKIHGDPFEEFVKTNIEELESSNIIVARKARNKFLKYVEKVLDNAAKKAIFTKENNIIGATCKFISKDEIEFYYTNAMQFKHEEFGTGNMMGFLVELEKYWNYEIKYLKEKSFQNKNGWCKNVWQINFKKIKNNNLTSKEIYLEKKLRAYQDFLLKVLDDSRKQKEIAEKAKHKISLLANQLSKFIPPQMHHAMMQGDFTANVITKRKKLTIFFSDIKDFTNTSESLKPKDLTAYLNEYFSKMTEIALSHGATIDKYIGDAIMLFFGDPISKGIKEDAKACLKMSLEMQKEMKNLQNKWKKKGFTKPFEIRIGINTGYCNVGNFGSEQRLTYTIIGDAVNIASRLESKGKAGNILISGDTYSYVKNNISVKEKNIVGMKGVTKNIKIYEVLSYEDD